MAEQKIRIKLKSYDHRALDEAAKKIVDTATRAGATVSGPIPLPIKRNLYTILKSPHTDKKSREQFEFKTYKRLIDLSDISQKTIEALGRIDLAAGVDIQIKV